MTQQIRKEILLKYLLEQLSNLTFKYNNNNFENDPNKTIDKIQYRNQDLIIIYELRCIIMNLLNNPTPNRKDILFRNVKEYNSVFTVFEENTRLNLVRFGPLAKSKINFLKTDYNLYLTQGSNLGVYDIDELLFKICINTKIINYIDFPKKINTPVYVICNSVSNNLPMLLPSAIDNGKKDPYKIKTIL